MAKKHTRESIYELLMTNDKAVCRAVVAIKKFQTHYEQQAEATVNHNDVGFAPCDARKMTSMATQFETRGFLSPKQIAWLRAGTSDRFPSRIGKYAGQLARIANGEQTFI